MDKNKMYLLASDVAISEQEPSSIFMLIDMRICSTQANRNSEGVTEAFIDEVVANQEKYLALPLYADVWGLEGRQYDNLTHLFDAWDNTFHTSQIGSFTKFEKVTDEYGMSLMGQIRIPKRQTMICDRLNELYILKKLNFSFEINYAVSDVVKKDGVIYIDASENNALTGVAVVSVPAYRESKAISLVAEEDPDKELQPGNNLKVAAATATLGKGNEKEGANDMNLEEATARIAELEKERDSAISEKETAIAEKETVSKELEEVKTSLAEKETKIQEQETAIAEKDQAISEKETAIAEKDQTIAELEPMKKELEEIKTAKAEEEKKANQEKARAFAEKQGLDLEDEKVKDAVEKYDYTAIACLVMDMETKEPELVIGGFSDGMKLESRYGDMLKENK